MNRLTRPHLLPGVLLLVGTLFNLAYAFSETLWNTHFLLFGYYFVLLLFLYSVLLIGALIKGSNKPSLLLLAVYMITWTGLTSYFDPEWFRAPKILEAVLYSDFNGYHLLVRADESCTIKATGLFGFTDTYDGQCEVTADRIHFHERPYPNDFIPASALIVDNLIPLKTTATGAPEDSYLAFEIIFRR